jgi:hypothetical protein
MNNIMNGERAGEHSYSAAEDKGLPPKPVPGSSKFHCPNSSLWKY